MFSANTFWVTIVSPRVRLPPSGAAGMSDPVAPWEQLSDGVHLSQAVPAEACTVPGREWHVP